MRVQEILRKTVVFVGVENDRGEFTPLGTGLLGHVQRRGLSFNFLVTAAHVVDQVAGEDFWMRLNRKSGESNTVRMAKKFALLHSDPHCDIAAFPMPLDRSVHDFIQAPLDREQINKLRHEVWDAECGDEVCTIGLYTSHYGASKNIPVVRIGHIAMMPGEPVRTETGYVVGFLIETKSIAGLSGSPVYVNVPELRSKGGEIQHLTHPTYPIIGILIGYHVVESKQDQISVPQFQESSGAVQAGAGRGIDERNTGFAVVVPIERVLEIVEQEGVIRWMESTADQHYASSGYRQAGTSEAVQNDGRNTEPGGDDKDQGCGP